MSCIGQSAATHSSPIPSANQHHCDRVTAGVPAGTTFGPITRAA